MAGLKVTALEPRPRGRPATLSSEAIVETALAMLDARPSAELSLAAIARHLNVTASALYRYFPTWTSLLTAMSVAAFRDFPDLPEGEPPVNQLLFWQKEVAALYRRHQGVLMLMGWDDKLSGPWLRVQMPVLMLLRQMGFEKRALVETLSWFLAGTVGLVRTYLAADMEDVRSGDQLDLADSLAYLTPEQRALIAETSPWVGAVDPDAILEAGFRALIDGVVKARAAL